MTVPIHSFYTAQSYSARPQNSHRQSFGPLFSSNETSGFERVAYEQVRASAGKYFGNVGRDSQNTEYSKLNLTLTFSPSQVFTDALQGFMVSSKKNMYVEVTAKDSQLLKFFRDELKLHKHSDLPAGLLNALNEQLSPDAGWQLNENNASFFTTGRQDSGTYIVRKDINHGIPKWDDDVYTYHVLVVKNPNLAKLLQA